MEKIRIRDKHPGSATLKYTLYQQDIDCCLQPTKQYCNCVIFELT
jgi:hypothetical protein